MTLRCSCPYWDTRNHSAQSCPLGLFPSLLCLVIHGPNRARHGSKRHNERERQNGAVLLVGEAGIKYVQCYWSGCRRQTQGSCGVGLPLGVMLLQPPETSRTACCSRPQLPQGAWDGIVGLALRQLSLRKWLSQLECGNFPLGSPKTLNCSFSGLLVTRANLGRSWPRILALTAPGDPMSWFFSPILQTRKGRLSEAESVAQGHTVGLWLRQDSNPGLWLPERTS